MIIWRYIVTFLLLIFCCNTQAQNLTAEAIDIRNRAENDIQKNLVNLISTQLDPITFTVAARVKVAVMPKDKAPDKKDKSDKLPDGMDIGHIDVREVLESYEKQIEELKITKEGLKEEPNRYSVKEVEVVVGLSDTYSDEYVKQFSAWLKKRIQSDYGNIAKSAVGKVQLKNSTQNSIKSPSNGESPKNDFILALAIAFLAIVLLLSIFLLGQSIRNGFKDISIAHKNIKLESADEPWSIENIDTLKGKDQNPTLSAGEVGEKFSQILDKISCVCMEINSNINELARIWMDNGEEGFLKTALLIDTMIYAKEKLMKNTQEGVIPLRIPLDMELMKSKSEQLSTAYSKMIQLSDDTKFELLEKVYWDLISVRTLGIKSLRRPFDFLQGMTPQGIKTLLDSQQESAQAIAIAYLPNPSKEQFLDQFDESNKAELLRNMLLTSYIEEQVIWDIDTSLEVVALNQNASTKEKLIDLFPKTLEALKTLNQVQEINILRQISPSLPDQGANLKMQYSTLAFIDIWKPDYIRKLVQNATADEILSLIQLIPKAKDQLLTECSPKMKIIIEDDLKLNATPDEGVQNKKLTSLRNKWNRVAASENLVMSKVIINEKVKSGDTNVAA